MLFDSYAFLLEFLPAAIVIYWFADKSPYWRTWVLIALSLAFYGYWDARFLPILVISILLNWGAANLFAASKRHAVITAAIVLNLVVLAFFKYTDFLATNFASLLGFPVPQFRVLLPLGISFFTFHHIMYLVDLGRGKAPIYPLDRYALYICFFPQAIAGPIARWSEVIHQFGQRAFAPGWQRRCSVAATFIIIGLVEKVLIADELRQSIDPIYDEALSGPVLFGQAWLGLAFAFQVFFDFAGYSDIAIGLGLIFGVTLPRNFDAPFRAVGIRNFWRCWHMTLTRFLRDYLYIPLGGNRLGNARQIFAIMITLALGGLWHGAAWTFVLWGTLHGVAISGAAVWQKYLRAPPAFVAWPSTIVFVILAFVIFRAGSIEAAWHIYQGLGSVPLPNQLSGMRTLAVAVLCAIVLPPSHEICRRLTEQPHWSTALILAAAAVVIVIWMGTDVSHEFIYFQF